MKTITCPACRGAQWLAGRKCQKCGGAGILQEEARRS